MPYQVKKYDGTELVTIPDYQYNDTSTTVVLFGKGVTNYGQPMAENLVHLMENFAGPTAPGLPARLGDPLVGQLWYDTMNRKLRVRSPTANWDVVGAANVGATPPTPPNQGDLWLDTSTDPAKLKIYNGEKWQLVGSSAAVGSVPTSGTYSTGEVGDLDGSNYFNTTSLGTNAEPQVGDLWWDYGTKQFKIYEGTRWDWVGPIMDKDRDTFISPEGLDKDNSGNIIIDGNPTLPGTDDDALHFVTGGFERFTIQNNKVARFVPENFSGALTLPRGTLEQRPGQTGLPTPEWGMVRYNTSQKRFEGFINNNATNTNASIGVWAGLGGVIDVDQDTYISAEGAPNNPGHDDDILHFVIQDVEFARMLPPVAGPNPPGLHPRPYRARAVNGQGQPTGAPRVGGNIEFYSNGYMLLPKGYTDERPSSTDVLDGMARYNQSKNQIEFRIAGSWVGFKNPRPFSGQEDVDFYSSIRYFFNHSNLVTISGATQQMTDVGIQNGQKLIHVVHNLEEPYVFVQIYDDKRQMIIPDEIYLVDKNNVYIDVSSFLQNVGGNWQLSSSGKGPTNIPNYTNTDPNATLGKWCAVITR